MIPRHNVGPNGNGIHHLLLMNPNLFDLKNKIQFLIEKKADINLLAVNFGLKSPLHCIIEHKQIDPSILNLLLDKKADPNIFHYSSRVPIKWPEILCKYFTNCAVVELRILQIIFKYDFQFKEKSTYLYLYIMRKRNFYLDKKVIEFLICNCAREYTITKKENEAYPVTCIESLFNFHSHRTDIIALLIERDYDIFLVDKDSNNIFHLMFQMRHGYDFLFICDLLIKRGIEKNACNKHGKTPLDIAFKNTFLEKKFLRELISRGFYSKYYLNPYDIHNQILLTQDDNNYISILDLF